MAFLEANHLTGVECNHVLGFNPSDLARLVEFRFDDLNVVFAPDQDGLAAIQSMIWLRSLSVATCERAIDLRGHGRLESLALRWHARSSLPQQMNHLRALRLWNYTPKCGDLSELPEAPNLTFLSLAQSATQLLAGIQRFPRLEVVHLAHLRKLSDLADISRLHHVTELWIQKCPALTNLGTLSALTSLRRLRLAGAKVGNISFIRALPQMELFDLGDSVVLDGEMSPLIGVRDVYFKNRSHYSHTLNAVQEATELEHRRKHGIPETGLS